MNLLAVILSSIPILFWHGVDAEHAEELLPMLKESGADLYLCRYKDAQTAFRVMDAAAANGIGMYVNYPELLASPETECGKVMNHPAFVGYYVKDEPEVWDISGLDSLVSRIQSVDPNHPCYINLYPNWAWIEDQYAERIEKFASEVEVPFYSFDQYPVTQADDGSILIRPTWYRNLEEFSAMAKRHGKPFWAFALTASHHLGAPSPPAFYPVPTLEQLRLQVYSDLIYGAQVIQYFTFRGLYDKESLEKTEVFDVVKQMNKEIKDLSFVFDGCSVQGVWHDGPSVPAGTRRLDVKQTDCLKRFSTNGGNAAVSIIKNQTSCYFVVLNTSCTNNLHLDIAFKTKAKQITKDNGDITPGNIRIFKLTH
uniref:Glycoside hydrolase family 42 N-terminal domain-containing protein n=1 Tax=uncultured bacterium fosmid pJB92C9 TaxID=1478074 RepID=A0A0H3UA21_9BACT|nr:hypothetical protein [uncultured bacterium fosmid pJB92C9]